MVLSNLSVAQARPQRAFQYWKNIDADIGRRIEKGCTRGVRRSPPKAWARAEPTLWRGATAPRMASGVAGEGGHPEKTICYQNEFLTDMRLPRRRPGLPLCDHRRISAGLTGQLFDAGHASSPRSMTISVVPHSWAFVWGLYEATRAHRCRVGSACSFFAVCTHSNRQAGGEHAPDSMPMERLTVLTYNILHGLEVRGWSVGLESEEEQRTRFNVQARQLALAQPDVMLLQEVNPLPEKAEAFAGALKAFGSEYTEVHQADACGIRLFGLRLIPGLNNGMAVLVKAPLCVRKVAGLKLSGGIGGCGDLFGLQFGELRYALIAEIDNPTTGNKFLAVSLHLHSGIERTAYFIQRVIEAEKQGRVEREAVQGFVVSLGTGPKQAAQRDPCIDGGVAAAVS